MTRGQYQLGEIIDKEGTFKVAEVLNKNQRTIQRYAQGSLVPPKRVRWQIEKAFKISGQAWEEKQRIEDIDFS